MKKRVVSALVFLVIKISKNINRSKIKRQANECFMIGGKEDDQKSEYVRFKNYDKRITSTFLINADFEGILLPENNWKQNLNQPYTSKCKKDVTSGYDYELVYVDNKCSKLLKSHLGNDGILLIV